MAKFYLYEGDYDGPRFIECSLDFEELKKIVSQRNQVSLDNDNYTILTAKNDDIYVYAQAKIKSHHVFTDRGALGNAVSTLVDSIEWEIIDTPLDQYERGGQ